MGHDAELLAAAGVGADVPKWINTWDVVSDTNITDYTGEEGNTYINEDSVGTQPVNLCAAATGRLTTSTNNETRAQASSTDPAISGDRVFKFPAKMSYVNNTIRGQIVFFPIFIDLNNYIIVVADNLTTVNAIHISQRLAGVNGPKSYIYIGTLLTNYPSNSDMPFEITLVNNDITLKVGAESVTLNNIDASLVTAPRLAIQATGRSTSAGTASYGDLTIDYQ